MQSTGGKLSNTQITSSDWVLQLSILSSKIESANETEINILKANLASLEISIPVVSEQDDLLAQLNQVKQTFNKRIVMLEKRVGGLESWASEIKSQLGNIKTESKETKDKIAGLQSTFDRIINEQSGVKRQQQSYQKQLAVLRSQLDSAQDQAVDELRSRIQQLEASLTQISESKMHDVVKFQLEQLRQEFVNNKKVLEVTAKSNASLRTQLQSVISESDDQIQKITQWQDVFSQQIQAEQAAQAKLFIEMQAELAQTKSILNKRIGVLEKSHQVLEQKVEKSSVLYTLGQKLLKLREAILNDAFITQELAYYIAPNGETREGLCDLNPLYEWVNENFLTINKVTTVLLQGVAGSGKSTFNRFLLRKLWQSLEWNTFQPGQPLPKVKIPVFIPLGSPKVNLNNLLHYLTELPELIDDLTEAEVNYIKQHSELLLIADGYDEIPGQQSLNLYDLNQFNKYEGRINLLISCRTERAYELDDSIHFKPHNNDGNCDDSQFLKRYVAGFTDAQIEDYIRKYLAQNKNRTDIVIWPEVSIYLKQFSLFPELKKLITTPIMLLMTIEIMPKIISDNKLDEKSESKTIDDLTRAKLYDYFTENYFKRQADKAKKNGDTTPPKELMKDYKQFCLKFAECLRRAGVSSVQYPYRESDLFSEEENEINPKGPRGNWVKQLLGTENARMLNARKGAPLLVGTGNYYQFIHASFIDYFLTTSIAHQNKPNYASATNNNISSNLELPNKNEQERTPIVKTSSDEELLSEKYLSLDQIYLLSDRIKTDAFFKSRLNNFIERSKEEKSMSIASANAITILNAAGEVFSDRDYQKIRIPGANLSGAILDHTNLEKADLRNVNLKGAWLRSANLRKAKMNGLYLGEKPFLKLPHDVTAVAYSSDCQLLAVGCFNSNIYFYESKTSQLSFVLKGTYIVSSVAFGSDDLLASGSRDKTVRLWDVRSQKCLHTFEGHTKDVTSVAFGKDNLLASGSEDNTIRLWDVKSLEYIQTLEGHTSKVNCVAFSVDNLLASGSQDYTVRLWDVKNLKCLHILKGHTDWVYSIAFGPDNLLASGNGDTVRLWDIKSLKSLYTLKGHTEDVRSVAFGPDNLLASGSSDTTVLLWDVKSQKCLQTFEGHTDKVNSVAFISGNLLASGSNDRTLRSWDIKSQRCLQIYEGNKEKVLSVFFGTDNLLALGSNDKTIRVWAVRNHRCSQIFEMYLPGVRCVALSLNNLLALGSCENSVHLWDVKLQKCLQTLKGHTDWVTSVAFGPENLLVSCSRDNTIRLWDVRNLNCLHILKGHTGHVTSVTFGPNNLLASGSEDKTVRLWNLQSTKCIQTLEGHTKWVMCVAFGPDDLLASGGSDSTVRLWDAKSQSCLQTFEGHLEGILSLAFGPDNLLASGSYDNTIRLWNVKNYQCLTIITITTGLVNSIIWQKTSDGIFLATGSDDKAVRYWKINRQGHDVKVILLWSTHQAALVASETDIFEVEGLSEINNQLFKLCGAVNHSISQQSRFALPDHKATLDSKVSTSRTMPSSTSIDSNQGAAQYGLFAKSSQIQEQPLLSTASTPHINKVPENPSMLCCSIQ